jgi:hypothetical protein
MPKLEFDDILGVFVDVSDEEAVTSLGGFRDDFNGIAFCRSVLLGSVRASGLGPLLTTLCRSTYDLRTTLASSSSFPPDRVKDSLDSILFIA